MATAQKTTIRRWNGTDWDSIYLATVADIVALGKGANITKTEVAPFKYDDALEIGDNVADLLIAVINRMATLDADVIPGLASGSGVTELDVSKLKGTISRANLPADVGGKGVEVANEDAKDALTAEQVNIGDIVKVIGGKVYQVNGYTTTGEGETGTKTPTYMALSDDAGDVAWSRVKNTPTTLDGYGITDAVKAASLVDHGTATETDVEGYTAAGKPVKADSDGELNFNVKGSAAKLGGQAPEYYGKAADVTSLTIRVTTNEDAIQAINDELDNFDASNIKTGLLPVGVIPKVALSEMHVVTAYSDLANLTTTQVQQGDTVKIADEVDDEGNITKAGEMYYVADSTKLGTADWENAYLPYTASQASAVDWSGVLNKPTTLGGYGITDAVNTSLVTDTATAGKLLKLDAEGKLPADITGSAAKLGGQAPEYYGKAADVTKLTNDLKSLSDQILGADGGDGTSLADRVQDIEDAIGDTTTAGTILKEIADLKAGTTITALAANKLTGTVSRSNLPTDIGGKVVEKTTLDAAKDELTAADVNVGDLLKLADGKLYKIVNTADLTADASYKLLVDVGGSNIAWSKITGTPTTLNGYGITDAVAAADVIVEGIPAAPAEGEAAAVVAGKLVKIASDNKLHVNISGDAATLGGHNADYFATKAKLDEVSLRAPMILNSLDELTDPAVGQVVLIPVQSNNILTDLDSGEATAADHLSARSFRMTNTTTGESEAVNPADIKMTNVN